MNKISKLFITAGIAVASTGLSSCIGDLDLVPTDPNQITAGSFDENPEGYMQQVLGDVYLSFATEGCGGSSPVQNFNGGMIVFQRAIFNLEEIPSDEINWVATDQELLGVQYNNVPDNHPLAYGVWSRLTINITLCNDFIRTVNDGLFKLNAEQQKKAEKYIRECKVLRSACYFYLLTLYGNAPYANENTNIGASPAQLSRADLYKQVVADLETVSAEFPENDSPAYGYVGKDVCDGLLVKLYLNAQVFSGTPAWDKCYAKANEIIKRHQGVGLDNSGLAKSYACLFGANAGDYAIGGSNPVNEILWVLPYDQTNLKTWGATTMMVDAVGYDAGVQGGVDPADAAAVNEMLASHPNWKTIQRAGKLWVLDPEVNAQNSRQWINANDAWVCISARPQLANQFLWNEPEMKTSPDLRVANWATAATGFSFDKLDYTQNGVRAGGAGFLPIKWTNWAYNDDGTINLAKTPVAQTQCSGGFALLRLAEIYLSAAEAALNGGGDTKVALDYVNLLRKRAGLGKWDMGDLNLEAVHAERQRELYMENTRRTDLIRYGKWVSGYNWAWKNNALNGRDLEPGRDLYPIPTTIMTLNPGYTQNPHY